jgi:hypothetical protein
MAPSKAVVPGWEPARQADPPWRTVKAAAAMRSPCACRPDCSTPRYPRHGPHRSQLGWLRHLIESAANRRRQVAVRSTGQYPRATLDAGPIISIFVQASQDRFGDDTRNRKRLHGARTSGYMVRERAVTWCANERLHGARTSGCMVRERAVAWCANERLHGARTSGCMVRERAVAWCANERLHGARTHVCSRVRQPLAVSRDVRLPSLRGCRTSPDLDRIRMVVTQ